MRAKHSAGRAVATSVIFKFDFTRITIPVVLPKSSNVSTIVAARPVCSFEQEQ